MCHNDCTVYIRLGNKPVLPTFQTIGRCGGEKPPICGRGILKFLIAKLDPNQIEQRK